MQQDTSTVGEVPYCGHVDYSVGPCQRVEGCNSGSEDVGGALRYFGPSDVLNWLGTMNVHGACMDKIPGWPAHMWISGIRTKMSCEK